MMKPTNILVRLRISGEAVCQRIAPMVCRDTGLELGSLEKVVLSFLDDWSGIDEENSYVQLKSGVKSVINTDPILRVAAETVPELPDNYETIAWDIPEFCRLKGPGPHLSDREVDVLFGPDPTSVTSEQQLRSYLEALLSCEHKYLDDLWLGETTVGHQLVRSALVRGKFSMLQEILGGCLAKVRESFLLAVAIVEELDQSCSQNAQPLVAMLMGDDSPLTNHYIDVLTGKLGFQQGQPAIDWRKPDFRRPPV